LGLNIVYLNRRGSWNLIVRLYDRLTNIASTYPDSMKKGTLSIGSIND
jgi:hypothetical protein